MAHLPNRSPDFIEEAIRSIMAAKKGVKRKEPILKKISHTDIIPQKKGNGQLRIEYLINEATGEVVTYSMAYINDSICSVDNGRVIGFDNAHGEHHKHVMGQYIPVEFESFAKTMKLFEDQWHQHLAKRKSK